MSIRADRETEKNKKGDIVMTREQYIRSNKVAYPLIILTCAVVMVTLFGALGQGSATGSVWGQIIGIIISMGISTASFLLKRGEKIGMIGVAFGGALMYFVVSFLNNNEYIFLYGFVILFVCMTYLNMRLIIWGNSFIVIGFIGHCIRMSMNGTFTMDLIFMAVITIALCGIGSIGAIRLLLKFNDENVAVISEKLQSRKRLLQ